MTRVLVGLLIIVVWIGLTTVAAALTPDRAVPDAKPDLSVDPHWLLRTPPNPVQYDRAPSVRTAVAITAAERFTTPPPTTRAAAPRPQTTTTTASPVPGGVVDPACLTGTAKTQAESDRCWRPLVDDYPWSVEIGLDVIWCESKGDETAVNSIGATGLFQLYDGTPNGAPYPGGLDPATNVRLAYEVKYSSGAVGFVEDWVSSRGCWG